MVVREHTDAHRQATWLELFFHLSFVVAVAQAAIQLERFLAEGHPGSGLVSYPDGLWRDLVGVDGVHMVRQRLRH
ncbi:MAG: hypothetical protein ACREM1_03920 [Longimicrobiales bacterium]